MTRARLLVGAGELAAVLGLELPVLVFAGGGVVVLDDDEQAAIPAARNPAAAMAASRLPLRVLLLDITILSGVEG